MIIDDDVINELFRSHINQYPQSTGDLRVYLASYVRSIEVLRCLRGEDESLDASIFVRSFILHRKLTMPPSDYLCQTSGEATDKHCVPHGIMKMSWFHQYASVCICRTVWLSILYSITS